MFDISGKQLIAVYVIGLIVAFYRNRKDSLECFRDKDDLSVVGITVINFMWPVYMWVELFMWAGDHFFDGIDPPK